MNYKNEIEIYSDKICELLELNSLIYPEQAENLRNYILGVCG